MGPGSNPCHYQDCARGMVAVSCIDTHATRRNTVSASGNVHFGRKLARNVLRENPHERTDNADVDRADELFGHPAVVIASPLLCRWLCVVLIGVQTIHQQHLVSTFCFYPATV